VFAEAVRYRLEYFEVERRVLVSSRWARRVASEELGFGRERAADVLHRDIRLERLCEFHSCIGGVRNLVTL
jgi:hypothetical protein